MSLVLDCSFWSFVTGAMFSNLQRCGFADWTGFLCTWIVRENPHSISYIFGRICGIFGILAYSFFCGCVTGVMFSNLQRCFLMTAAYLDFLRFVLENYKQGFWIFWDLFWKTINKFIVTYEGITMFDAIPVPWCHWLHNALLSSVLVAAALCISLGSFFFASRNWTNWNVAGYVSTVVFDICSWSCTFWCIVLSDDLRGFYMVAELP